MTPVNRPSVTSCETRSIVSWAEIWNSEARSSRTRDFFRFIVLQKFDESFKSLCLLRTRRTSICCFEHIFPLVILFLLLASSARNRFRSSSSLSLASLSSSSFIFDIPLAHFSFAYSFACRSCSWRAARAAFFSIFAAIFLYFLEFDPVFPKDCHHCLQQIYCFVYEGPRGYYRSHRGSQHRWQRRLLQLSFPDFNIKKYMPPNITLRPKSAIARRIKL